MRKLTVWIVAFLALCAVVGFVATGGLVGGAGSADSSAPFAAASGSMAPETGKAVAGPTSLGAPGAAEGATAGGAGLRSTGIAGIGGIPAIGLAVVKTASLDVQVAKDDFAQAFRTALDVAGKYGGYVQSSSSSGTTVHSGSITIRVPSSSFEQAMNDLSSLGQVRSRSISGQDVTNEYVDLNARLRTWQAQEAVLLRLMRRATSIESTLRVQTNLQDVQFRIEQIKGQLRVLENQTQLATIDVAIHEPGAVVHPLQRPKPAERPSLAEAWTKAVNGFLGVLYATVVGLGYLVPIGLICLAVWFGVRRVRIGPAASS